MNKPSIVYFGTSEFATYVLDELEQASLLPDLIVCTPDKPQGRKLVLTPPPVKLWAQERGIEVLQPESLRKGNIEELLTNKAPEGKWDVFIVASYGKIIPDSILNIPTHKTLNVHPSLLPILRGPSPIESAMLQDLKHTGVSIMRLDAEMDHGPILTQEIYTVSEWPKREILELELAHRGGRLLSAILPQWINGDIKEIEQDHSKATYCKKIEKEEALLDLSADPYTNFRKIQAYSVWPRAYYFIEKDGKKTRVVITEAEFADNQLIIKKVIPEGKREMTYAEFQRGHHDDSKRNQ